MKKKDTEKAIELMKYNKVDKLFHTSDGEFFIDENSAQNHALREHGSKREKALKVEPVKLSDLTGEKEADKKKLTKEELEANYDELFEKTETAKKTFETKQSELDKARKNAEDKKGSDKEAEADKTLKQAETAFKSAETKLNKLSASLEEVEKVIENFEA